MGLITPHEDSGVTSLETLQGGESQEGVPGLGLSAGHRLEEERVLAWIGQAEKGAHRRGEVRGDLEDGREDGRAGLICHGALGHCRFSIPALLSGQNKKAHRFRWARCPRLMAPRWQPRARAHPTHGATTNRNRC